MGLWKAHKRVKVYVMRTPHKVLPQRQRQICITWWSSLVTKDATTNANYSTLYLFQFPFVWRPLGNKNIDSPSTWCPIMRGVSALWLILPRLSMFCSMCQFIRSLTWMRRIRFWPPIVGSLTSGMTVTWLGTPRISGTCPQWDCPMIKCGNPISFFTISK